VFVYGFRLCRRLNDLKVCALVLSTDRAYIEILFFVVTRVYFDAVPSLPQAVHYVLGLGLWEHHHQTLI
jgi:hypothetical protein